MQTSIRTTGLTSRGCKGSGRGDLPNCDYPIKGRAVNHKITQSPRAPWMLIWWPGLEFAQSAWRAWCTWYVPIIEKVQNYVTSIFGNERHGCITSLNSNYFELKTIVLFKNIKIQWNERSKISITKAIPIYLSKLNILYTKYPDNYINVRKN